MRLTFEHDLEIMLTLAASIADSVARASGRFDLREDAESDALVELLEIEFDPENPGWQAYLKKRVGGVLFRRLQNESGSRLKEPPRFVSIVEDVAAPEPEEEEPEAMSAADEIKKAGVQGEDRSRLGKLWKNKQASFEIKEEPKETKPSPFDGFKAALERADSLETLEDVRNNIEAETTLGNLTGDEFGALTETFQKRAAELDQTGKKDKQKPTTSQNTNYNGLLKALGDAKSKEEVAKLAKGCDGYVKKGLLTHDQALRFLDACRKHEETLLI